MGAFNIFWHLHQARKNQWLKTSELEEIQAKRLRAIVKHAYENTAYYHRTFEAAGIIPDDIKTPEDLKKLPFVTKDDIRKYGLTEMVSRGIILNKCRIVPTSGSTGTPMKIVYDKVADDFSKAINLRSMIENGFKFRDQMVNLGDMRTAKKPSWYQRLGILNFQTIDIFDNIDKEVCDLVKIHPDSMLGYASQLRLLSEYKLKHNLKELAPKTLFSTSEVLDVDTRRIINTAFNLKVVDLFGCIEVNRTAWECPEHCGYHTDIDSVVMELLDDGRRVSAGEPGEVVYTSLYNYAMPLIRYQVGDVATPSDDICPCGRGLPLLKSVEGRKDDFIHLPSGNAISPITMHLIIKHGHGVVACQIIQERLNAISVHLVVTDQFTDLDSNHLIQEIKQALNNEVSVDIRIVDAIPRGANGKIRMVISHVNKK
jgi:phenylacetate-CoA ligase